MQEEQPWVVVPPWLVMVLRTVVMPLWVVVVVVMVVMVQRVWRVAVSRRGPWLVVCEMGRLGSNGEGDGDVWR